MSNAVYAAIKALLASPAVSTDVSTRIYPVVSPQEMQELHIIVNQISSDDPMIQDGHSGFPEARISIEARGKTATSVINLGDKINAALQPLHLQDFSGLKCSFRKEGTDVTDFADTSQTHRRILDFYVRSRVI